MRCSLATGATWALLVPALHALTHTAHATALVAQTIGEAFDLDSNKPLYSETHCVSGDALMREVIYKDAANQLIAYKVLDYATGSNTPSYVQHNVYSQDSIAVELEQERQEIIFTATDAERPDQPSVSSVKPGNALPVVIDAGFDAFVRENWHSLVAGERKQFQFPFAARESVVELSIASASCSYATETDQCFTLELNNWLLSMLADPIELGYDAKLQRLARFRGISNISDDAGEALAVDIHYRYDDVDALDCVVNEEEFTQQAVATEALPIDFTRAASPVYL
jgi:hypothetical protein